MGAFLFENCSSLTSVVDFRGINSFSEGMYAGSGLVNVTIPASITSLQSVGVFENCASLQSVTLHDGITGNGIGTKFFYNCTALKSITLPATITMIGEKTFMNCSALETVTANGPLSGIGVSAFENCSKLTAINYAGELPVMFGANERAFANCTSLTDATVMLEASDRLPAEVFLNCSSLTGVFNANTKFNDMGDFALSGTNFTTINLDVLDLNFTPNALSGIPSTTTINFLTYTESIARKRFGTALNNTEATLVFRQQGDEPEQPDEPDEPDQPTDSLTKEEEAGIKNVIGELGLSNESMSVLQESLLEFKRLGYTSNVTSEKPTEEELTYIRNVVAKIVDKGDEKLFETVYTAFMEKWTTYKKTLMMG